MARQYLPLASAPVPASDLGREPELDELGGNAAALETLGLLGGPPPDPSAPPPPGGAGGAGGGDPLPVLAEMEAAFDEDFGDLEVHLGVPGLRALGAAAVASADQVSFVSTRPDRETVAHELAHVVQARRSGGDPDDPVSRGTSSAETQADAVAARVAAGRPAGAVGGAPSATVHRDATADAPKSTGRWLEGQLYVVMPKAAYDAFAQVAAVPSNVVSDVDYQGLVDAAARRLVDRLTALGSGNVADWYLGGRQEVAQLVAHADPEVRVAAFRSLGEGSRAVADVRLAQALAVTLDPLTELRTMLVTDDDSDRKIELVGAWARRYGPETCRRALQDGVLHVQLGKILGAGGAAEATQLLLGAGVVQDTPANALSLAMYRKDPDGFTAAWAALKRADPAAAQARLADATFLEDVKSWVPDAYPTMLAELRAPASDAPAAPPALVDLVKPVADGIVRRIVATNGLTTPYTHAEDADPALASAADDVYAFRRSAVQAPTVGPTSADAGLGVERQAVEALRSVLPLPLIASYGTPEGRAPLLRALDAADDELGKRRVRDSGATELTADEQAAIRALADDYARRLEALETRDDAEDAAIEVLEQFAREANGRVAPGGGDPSADWAASERRRKAQLVLDQAFEARTGRPLRAWLEGLAFLVPVAAGVYDEQRAEHGIEDDPDAYSEVLTPLESKRLAPRFDEAGGRLGPLVQRAGTALAWGQDVPDGMEVGGYPLTLRVSRAVVAEELARLEATIRSDLEPVRKEGPFLAAWDKKVARAMAEFDRQLSAKYGSLRKALDDGSGDAGDARSALVRLGERADPTAQVRQDALAAVEGDATGAAAYLRELSDFAKSTAESFGRVLAPAMKPPPDPTLITLRWEPPVPLDEQISDEALIALASAFAVRADQYPQRVPGGRRADATRMLVAAFAPIGGSLAPLIAKGMAPELADRTLAMLGLQHGALGGTQTADLRQVEQQLQGAPAAPARAESDQEFGDRMQPHAASFSRGLASLPSPDHPLRGPVFTGLVQRARVLVGLARLAEYGDAKLRQVWFDRIGVSLPDDLGQHLVGGERATMAGLFGLAEADLPAPREVPGDLALIFDDPEPSADRFAFLRAVGVRPDEVSPTFTEERALSNAILLHATIEHLPGSQQDLRELLEVRPAELRVVRHVYRQIYGFDPRYQLGQVFPDDPAKVDEYAAQVQDGKGKVARNLVDAARTSGGSKEVLRIALQLSAAERRAVLQDPVSLGELRSRLGESEYDRLFQLLDGHGTLYDVIAADKELGADVEQWFEGRRATLLADPQLQAAAKGDPDRLRQLVEARLRQEGQQAYADPSVQKLLASKDGDDADDVFEAKARMLRGGSLTAKDRMTKAVIVDGDTDESALKTAAGDLRGEELAAVQADPLMQRRIASDLEDGGGDDKDANLVFAKLFAGDGMARLEQSHRDTPYGPNDYRAALPEYANGDALRTIFAMSPRELAELRRNPDVLQRVRAAMTEDNRAELDRFLSATGELGEDRGGDYLVESFVARFLDEPSSESRALEVAQACYARGIVTPPPGAPSGAGFGKLQRLQIWLRIEGSLDLDGKVYDAVRASLLEMADPTVARLSLGFAGKDRDSIILGAIDQAPPQTVIAWSNVLEDGPTAGYGSLKEKYDAWIRAEEAHRQAPDDPATTEQYLYAKNRYLDHRLDVNATLLDWFSKGGGDLKAVFPFATVATMDFGFDSPSDKRLLEMKSHLRSRILALTSDDVAPRIGLVAPPESADSDEPSPGEAEYQNRKATLVSEDRITRSEARQRDDRFHHETDEGGSGAEAERQRYLDAHHRYNLELAHATASGTMDDEAIRRVKARGADDDRLHDEMKKAQASLLELLELIADALIMLVAVAITGPAGMGFLASLMVAGAQSIAHSALEEMVDPANHSFDEAANNLLHALATTALTHGMTKVLQGAQAPLGLKGPMAKVAAFEEQLAKRASSSFGGMVIHTAYHTGKGVLTQPLNAVSETAFEMIDPGVWQYGWYDAWGHAESTFDQHLQSMGDGLKANLITNVATSVGLRVHGAVVGGTPVVAGGGDHGGAPPREPPPGEQAPPRSPTGGGGSGPSMDQLDHVYRHTGEMAMHDGHAWTVLATDDDAFVLARTDEHGNLVQKRVPHEEILGNPINEHLIDQLPAETVMQTPNAQNRTEAEDSYDSAIRHDPSREAAIYFNPWTGEHIVVQGARATVEVAPGEAPNGAGAQQRWKEILGPNADQGGWVLLRHYHPEGPSGSRLHQLPSDAYGDMGIVYATANAFGTRYDSEIDTIAPWGDPTITRFGYDPATQRFHLDYEVSPGQRQQLEFPDMAAYHRFLGQQGGAVNPVPPHLVNGPAPAPQPAQPPQAPRTGPATPDEVVHVHEGEFTSSDQHVGGGHGQENVAELRKRGYVEMTADDVRAAQKAEEPFVEASRRWQEAQRALDQWREQKRVMQSGLDRTDLGKLNDPKLPSDQRSALTARKAAFDEATADWEAKNPRPPAPGPKPKPEDHGLSKGYVPLSQRRYFYREPLANGAEIGGINPSKNPIHRDGHTWFPPGWDAAAVMALLEQPDPRVTEKAKTAPSGAVTARQRTAWIRREADGTYAIAPDGATNPLADGYVKVSMIVPEDGAGRTVFVEMRQ